MAGLCQDVTHHRAAYERLMNAPRWAARACARGSTIGLDQGRRPPYGRREVQQPLHKRRGAKTAGPRLMRRTGWGTTQLESVPEPKYWHLKTVSSPRQVPDSESRWRESRRTSGISPPGFSGLAPRSGRPSNSWSWRAGPQRRRGVGTTVAPLPRGRGRRHRAARPGRAPPETPGSPSTASRRCRAPPSPPRLETGSRGRPHRPPYPGASHGQQVAPEPLYTPAASVPGLTAIDAPSGAASQRVRCCASWHLPLEGGGTPRAGLGARADDAKEPRPAPRLAPSSSSPPASPRAAPRLFGRDLPRRHLPAHLRRIGGRGDTPRTRTPGFLTRLSAR